MVTVSTWPAANEYMEAIQNPGIAFSDPTLKDGTPALTRLGMPHVAAGNFAYVFKLKVTNGARAIKCFRQFFGDREKRYVAITKLLDDRSAEIPSFARFEYDAEGILVAGRRYPILEMEWLEGPTLDVYVDAALAQGRGREALTILGTEWTRLVKQLDGAGVAHGDLQHGNVIVTPTGLRLVDLDGMYVSALSGYKAGELGHPHFQHPRRTEEFFNATLDRFAALVIYTSLLALVERPALWSKYHDDNLIFKKDDFRDPNNSALFRELRGTSGELKRLVDTLGEAALSTPSATPRLVDLVQVQQIAPSKLPSWMREPIVIAVKTTSREADGVLPPPPLPRQVSAAPPPKTVTPIPAPSTSAPAGTPATTPEWFRAGCHRGFRYSLVGLCGFFLWIPMLSAVVKGLFNVSAKEDGHYLLVIVLYVAICITVGIWRQYVDRHSRKQQVVQVPQSQSATVPPRPWMPQTPRRSATHRRYTPPAHIIGTSTSPVVASSIRMIYHRPSCSWAAKISRRNQTSYSSAAAAASAGQRPCRVCHP